MSTTFEIPSRAASLSNSAICPRISAIEARVVEPGKNSTKVGSPVPRSIGTTGGTAARSNSAHSRAISVLPVRGRSEQIK
jgi:hypothetical protein